VIVPGLGRVQAGLFAGTDGLLLATNNVVPEGAAIIADGTVPVATPVPFAVNAPVVRSMLKAETSESPWVATKRAPVLEVVVELLLVQAFQPSSKTGSSKARTSDTRTGKN
jgi:hypothetical protein